MKGDDLENVCYLREDVPKWDGELGEPWLGPWYALVVFFFHHFLGIFFSPLLLGAFFCVQPNFWLLKGRFFLDFSEAIFFFEKKKGDCPKLFVIIIFLIPVTFLHIYIYTWIAGYNGNDYCIYGTRNAIHLVAACVWL